MSANVLRATDSREHRALRARCYSNRSIPATKTPAVERTEYYQSFKAELSTASTLELIDGGDKRCARHTSCVFECGNP